ncbi:NaeI family type II restriction endonuclease [Parvibaculum sp.]|uniref:NaeI family type II restriction endonuclease n=1 Tax=Parvibaculum sp. TaxID=2024848 RepID=UPI00272FFF74|nr:NaeI family type II restriction endonuclease [Parvibaculum sp.]MDP1628788.1 NaeI family type II restriction endonuclease [Parvibaculum sp.]MDP2148183.1 NaeI family type II restriction endonuclease [Parvibaculum sp.]MDP3328270.1 NaeI family type II restriction endonuclease [Parvibaculum sp.]
MKQKIPESLVHEKHDDYKELNAVYQEIVQRAGGLSSLRTELPKLLRGCIDGVIQTPKTGRRSYEELEKTEKTYIGTCVEIELRAYLKLPKGKLDTVIAGRDVDIKHTMGSNWMIPTEAVNNICILVAADEARAQCYLGLFLANPEYLTAGQNKDSKKSLSAFGFRHIHWLFRDEPYPKNFWRTLLPETVEEIFSGASGNDRVVSLFRAVQGTPISRDVVNAVARQKDFTRRIRADSGNGTRDRLAEEGILLLGGTQTAHKQLATRFGLKLGSPSDYISFQVTTNEEREAARAAGFNV